MTTNLIASVWRVVHIYIQRVPKRLLTGSLLGLEGWRRHWAVSLCDYHWLWGDECILVWGGVWGWVSLLHHQYCLRMPLHTGYLRQHIISGPTVTELPLQHPPAGLTPCQPRPTWPPPLQHGRSARWWWQLGWRPRRLVTARAEWPPLGSRWVHWKYPWRFPLLLQL